MSRIDVQTLVMVFEKRIEALEKNPPDKVLTHVVIKMLEESIDSIIKDHFAYLVRMDMRKLVKNKFKDMKDDFISKTAEGILKDEDFRKAIENKIKESLIVNIKKG